MKPYYEDHSVTIYHGDCLEVMPLITVPVDLILTDPPYGVAYVTNMRHRNDPLRVAIANDLNLDVVSQAFPMALRLLSDNRHWYAFASPRRISEAEKIFGKPKHLLAWDNGDRGTVGDLEAGFGEAWEAIFYGMKGRRPLNGPRPRTVIRYDWSSTMDPVHPTVKPVPLLKKLVIYSTFSGELVLDPFMGSGTSLRAAKDLGRKAVGIELDERYCEIAARRMQQEVLL